MSMISRRAALANSLAVAVALTLPARRAGAADWHGYREAIVIDGLGGPGSLNAVGEAPLADALVRDTRDSGITCTHVTVGSVGTTAPDAAFTRTVRDIAYWEREIAAHPNTFAR